MKSYKQRADDVLRSKASVAVLIDEYEKLRQPLVATVKEKMAKKEKELLEENAASKEPTAEDGVVTEGSSIPENGTQDTQDSDEVKSILIRTENIILPILC